MRQRRLVVLVFAAFCAFGAAGGKRPAPTKDRQAAVHPVPAVDLTKLPLYFEPNVGQAAPGVRYIARGGGMTMFLAGQEAIMVLNPPASREGPRSAPNHERAVPPRSAAIRMRLAGATGGSEATELERLPGISNYFRGRDESRWITGVPQYRRVRFRNVYEGVDVVYYGNQQHIEYDLIVAPGVDPHKIELAWEGAESIGVDSGGDLILATVVGQLKQHRPRVYQEKDGKRIEIEAKYRLRSGGVVQLALARYDTGEPLIIDPTLDFSTTIPGITLGAMAIAIDSQGNVYVAGETDGSQTLPAVNGFQHLAAGNNDAFIAKLDATGSSLLYSTYLGGSDADAATGIALDNSSNAYVTGFTKSLDFPLVSAAQTTYGGGNGDSFIAKISPGGNQLIFSSYLGGSGTEVGQGVAVDRTTGNAYVTGYSESVDFPTTAGAYQTCIGGDEAFVAKYGPTGSRLFATCLGTAATFGYGVAVDSSGAPYVTGSTSSSFFPTTVGAYRTTLPGGKNAGFVTKLNTNGTALVYSTFLDPGTSASSIAIHSSGNVYVTGSTSLSLPTTSGAIQSTLNGLTDAFIANLNSTLSTMNFLTNLGGRKNEYVYGIAVDEPTGNAYVTGLTYSDDFPIANAVQPIKPTTGAILQRTADSGVSWQVSDIGVPHLRGYSVLIDAANPNILLLAASGAYLFPGGVYRSADSGGTWTQVLSASNVNGNYYEQVLQSPGNSSVMYAIQPIGVVRSNDSGMTWSTLSPNYSMSLAQVVPHPSNPSILYAAGWLNSSGNTTVLISTDSGSTWNPLNNGLAGFAVTQIAINPTNSNLIYAVGSGNGHTLYATSNGGANWTPSDTGLAYYASSIGVDPNAPSTLYAGSGFKVYRSTDSGAHWAAISTSIGQINTLVVSPLNSSVIWGLGWTTGVFKSTNGGATWTVSRPDISFDSLALHPTNANIAYAGNILDGEGTAFVAKVNATGTVLSYSTYLGGATPTGFYGQGGTGIAVDSAGVTYVAGSDNQSDFPLTPASYWPYSGNSSGFIAKIDSSGGCTYSTNPAAPVFNQSANSLKMTIFASSGCAWSLNSGVGWLTIQGTSSGTGIGFVTLSATANAGAERTTTLTVGTTVVPVKQVATGCFSNFGYPFLQTSFPVPQSGGFYSVNMTTGANCSWQIQNQNPWITITSPLSGIGPASVTFSVAPNYGLAPRTAQIVFTNYDGVLQVQQAGTCTYTLSRSAWAVSAAGGSGSVTVTTNSPSCTWDISSGDSWYTWNPTATQTGSAQINFNFSANTTGTIRTGTTYIAYQSLAITQDPRAPVLAFRDVNGGIDTQSFGTTSLKLGGGIFASDPTIAQLANGDTVAIARDTYSSLWANVFSAASQSWGSWSFGGGLTQGTPAVATDIYGTAWVAVRDNYNSYWLNSYYPGTNFGSWIYLAGIFSTDPVVASAPDGSIYIIGKDTYNSLWSGRYVPGSGFVGWQYGAGILKGKPSVAVGTDGVAYVAARDNFNSLWLARVQGDVWLGWTYGGGIMSSDPQVAALRDGRVSVVLADTGSVIWHREYTEGTSNGWQNWANTGGILQNFAPAGDDGDLYIAGRDQSNSLWWYRLNANQWTSTGHQGVATGNLSAAPK